MEHPTTTGTDVADTEPPAAEIAVYLSATLLAEAHGCALQITAGSTRLTICPQDLTPTADEVDAFELLVDAVLEVREALRDTFRDGAS